MNILADACPLTAGGVGVADLDCVARVISRSRVASRRDLGGHLPELLHEGERLSDLWLNERGAAKDLRRYPQRISALAQRRNHAVKLLLTAAERDQKAALAAYLDDAARHTIWRRPKMVARQIVRREGLPAVETGPSKGWRWADHTLLDH
jgi:hypothetical protein